MLTENNLKIARGMISGCLLAGVVYKTGFHNTACVVANIFTGFSEEGYECLFRIIPEPVFYGAVGGFVASAAIINDIEFGYLAIKTIKILGNMIANQQLPYTIRIIRPNQN